jgi:hypothetical protein
MVLLLKVSDDSMLNSLPELIHAASDNNGNSAGTRVANKQRKPFAVGLCKSVALR